MKTEEEYNAEVLQLMRDLYPTLKGEEKERAERLFPELKESEGERMKRILKEGFAILSKDEEWYDGVTVGQILTWFERQGEQKPADTVEPLFRIGDWVILNNDICQIVKREGGCNILVTQFGVVKEPVNERNLSTAKLWDISDAKDGDILCYKDEISLYNYDIKNYTNFGGFVYHCCYDGKKFIKDSFYSLTEQDKMDIYPATKEQRDTLMKAMADAGWEFDFEKKDLKKIEQKPAEWGKEDEEMLENIIDDYDDVEEHNLCDDIGKVMWLKSLKDRVQPKQEWSEEDKNFMYDTLSNLTELKDRYGEGYGKVGMCIDWLKSLKDRYTWKPSDEQMENLSRAFNGGTYQTSLLMELYNDLKKLREE